MTLETTPADAAHSRSDGRESTAHGAAAHGLMSRKELRRLAAIAALAEQALPADVAVAPDEVPTPPEFEDAQTADIVEPIVLEVIDTDAADESLPTAAEQVQAAPPVEETLADASTEDDAEHHDEFEFAARLFSFTGETPIQKPQPDASAPRTDAGDASPHVATGRRKVSRRVAAGRATTVSLSFGTMAIVGLLAIGTTTPAAAVAAPATGGTDIGVVSTKPKVETKDVQAFVSASGDKSVSLDRTENYNVASMAEVASDSGVTIFANTWINDPTAAIQWPFPVGVPVSAAFGSVSYLSQFSRPHRGVDLTPGAGAEVHVIAAGTVRIATEAGGDYGVTVVVDHIVDGQPVATRYGHMQYGSLEVEPGDTVEPGEVIGRVGSTGKATGPHLHFEVLLGGTTQTDPMVWMQQHTQG